MRDSISFDRYADRYDETRGGLVRGRRFADQIAAQLAPASRVLEAGVGTGAIALPLAQLGHTVVGIDIAPAMLARAYERLSGRVAAADAARIPMRDASCDAVVAVWMLHVVADRASFLAECRRVLRADGRVVIVPADAEEPGGDVADIVGELRRSLGRDRDLPGTIAPLTAAAGFDLVHDALMEPFEFLESPKETIAIIESRSWSSLWALDEERWASRVQPHIDRLRALPDTGRPRHRAHAHRLMVFKAAPVA